MDIETAFNKYHKSIVRSMTAFSGDESAAEDGAAQAFAQAAAQYFAFSAMPEPAAKAWLYASARNAVVDIKRRESRTVRFNGEKGGDEFADPRQNDIDGRTAVAMILQELPDFLRLPVELKYYMGMNSTEIGEVMSIPSATVRTRLHSAMRLLRAKI